MYILQLVIMKLTSPLAGLLGLSASAAAANIKLAGYTLVPTLAK